MKDATYELALRMICDLLLENHMLKQKLAGQAAKNLELKGELMAKQCADKERARETFTGWRGRK